MSKEKNKGSIIRLDKELIEEEEVQTDPLWSYKTLKRHRKKIMFHGTVGMLTVGLIGGFYFNSSVSRLNIVAFDGNNFLSKGTILKLTKLTYRHPVLLIRNDVIEKEIEKHPLVKEADVSKEGLNNLRIIIEEEEVLGCVLGESETSLLSVEGSLIKQGSLANQSCQGILFYEMDQLPNSESLVFLVQTLGKLEKTFLPLVESVTYEPEFGDLYRFSLQLKDGNVIKGNTYTMADKLAHYATMKEKVEQTYGNVKGVFHLDVGDRFEVRSEHFEAAMSHYEQLNQKPEKDAE